MKNKLNTALIKNVVLIWAYKKIDYTKKKKRVIDRATHTVGRSAAVFVSAVKSRRPYTTRVPETAADPYRRVRKLVGSP